QLLPALTQGLQNNLQQGGGLDALAGALQSGNHQRYLDDPASLATPAAQADGNGILGHLLGSKDVSRQLAAQVSGKTGVDAAAIKQMLPMVAALAMGALSKQTGGGAQLQGGAGDILGALLGGGDSDGQGGLGAVMGLAKKFL
ncbi:MAG: DUF937 domain-containing protein, partial [Gammaproteobacteria bacterium]|nr:DUF937 domain-containing protein [Gammaproteobacteria bacterium]